MADFDVIVVGAGCAGSVAATVAAKEGASVLLVERGNYAGAKNMTGGRIYTHSLKKVFPDFEDEAPLERRITTENISLTTATGNFTASYTSEALAQSGKDSYSVLRAPFDQWLAGKAEEAGADCIFGITVDSLVFEDGKVAGISAGGDEITGRVVILADGVNSLLAEAAGLAKRPPAHQIAVGVKETIELPEQVIDDRFRAAPGEGSAWLFAGDATKGHIGGAFLYTNKESLSLGLVATLDDLRSADTPIYQMLEDFKSHPAIAPLIAGGKLIEYSGHLIPEGGYNMIPKLYGDNCLLAGDAAMLCINLGYQVRGMDYAVASGEAAARTALQAVAADDTSAAQLAAYEKALKESFVLKDLEAYRRFPHFMESTTRIFKGYPEMVDAMMRSLFVVDGSPVEPMKKKMMAPVKEIGLMTLFKDARGGMKAL